MPIEAVILADAPIPMNKCPKCGDLYMPFMRGQVQRRPWKFNWRRLKVENRPYCAMICATCKEIVGYEEPINEGGIVWTPKS